MKLNEPIGKTDYAPLLIRVTLGAYFFLAGRMKLDNLSDFVQVVKQTGVLPDHFATLYGTLLPFVEVVVGVLLVFGLWTTLAAMLSSLMILSFVVALGPFSNRPFNKDIILLGASTAMLYLGGGAFSIDKLRKSG